MFVMFRYACWRLAFWTGKGSYKTDENFKSSMFMVSLLCSIKTPATPQDKKPSPLSQCSPAGHRKRRRRSKNQKPKY
jgi:hypothetical protein